MSAVYKVLEQMQKTRPRRIRGNREVMIVLGGIVIVGMLMLVSSLNKRLKADNERARQAQQLKVGTIDEGDATHGTPLIINISLNEQNQWVVDDHGVVTNEELLDIFAAKRALADEQGVLSIVRAQIDGEQPAKHFLELHRLAEQCEMDQVNVVTSEPLLDDEDT